MIRKVFALGMFRDRPKKVSYFVIYLHQYGEFDLRSFLHLLSISKMQLRRNFHSFNDCSCRDRFVDMLPSRFDLGMFRDRPKKVTYFVYYLHKYREFGFRLFCISYK
jgi:hypothetical protein